MFLRTRECSFDENSRQHMLIIPKKEYVVFLNKLFRNVLLEMLNAAWTAPAEIFRSGSKKIVKIIFFAKVFSNVPLQR